MVLTQIVPKNVNAISTPSFTNVLLTAPVNLAFALKEASSAKNAFVKDVVDIGIANVSRHVLVREQRDPHVLLLATVS